MSKSIPFPVSRDSEVERVNVLLTGEFQHGKSTLGKLLFPESSFVTGVGWKPTTQTLAEAVSPCLTVSAWDSPGNNANDEHSAELNRGIEKADIAIFVKMCARDFSETEIDLLVRLQQRRMPVVLLFNCMADSASALPADPLSAQNHEVFEAMHCRMQDHGINPCRTFVVNLAWAAVAQDKEHRDFKRIARSYTDFYPDDDRLEMAMVRSRTPEIRRYLLERGPHLFDSCGLLRHAVVGRFANRLRPAAITTER